NWPALKKARRSFVFSRMTLSRCSNASSLGTAKAGTAEHGGLRTGTRTRQIVEVVGLWSSAARLHDQLYGPPDARERGGPHHETVWAQAGTIRQSGICVRLGLCSGIDWVRNIGRSGVGSLGLSRGAFVMVRNGFFDRIYK